MSKIQLTDAQLVARYLANHTVTKTPVKAPVYTPSTYTKSTACGVFNPTVTRMNDMIERHAKAHWLRDNENKQSSDWDYNKHAMVTPLELCDFDTVGVRRHGRSDNSSKGGSN